MSDNDSQTSSRKVPGVGFDFGTSFLAASYQKGNSMITKSMRDCYVVLDKNKMSQELLARYKKILSLETDDSTVVLGDDAWLMAGSHGKDIQLRTPLFKGFINPDEQDAYDILKKMVHSLLGNPIEKNELAYFSIPAAPLDDESQDEIYHQSFLEGILEDLGYKAVAMNEAHAIAFSDCADSDYSGLCISWGHGMTNFCLTLDTLDTLKFSVGKGGSYIDQMSAKSIRANQVFMQHLKESPEMDLLYPSGREQKAIQAYYKALIKYALAFFKTQFEKVSRDIFLTKAIPIVVSGGTSLPRGFIELFTEVLGDLNEFPLKISEVKKAKDPLYAVSRGLLIKARSECQA